MQGDCLKKKGIIVGKDLSRSQLTTSRDMISFGIYKVQEIDKRIFRVGFFLLLPKLPLGFSVELCLHEEMPREPAWSNILTRIGWVANPAT